jgi:hypothetical protein
VKATSNHIDEQTLSRYVLQDKTISGRRDAIEQHLSECDGCRLLFEEIRQYYARVEQEQEENATLGKRHGKGLVKQQVLPEVWTESISAIVPRYPNTFPARVWHFAKRNPLISVSGSFVLTAVIVVAFTLFSKKQEDSNPSYFSVENNVLNIYNMSGEILWKKPIIHKDEHDFTVGSKAISILDVNMDGKNEVVTIFQIPNDKESLKNSLTVYNSNGTILWRENLGGEISYHGKKYADDYFIRKMLIHDYHGKKSIFVLIYNSHSPAAVVVLDLLGNIQTEFWNYGHFADLIFSDVDGDGKDELILSGILDEEDNPAMIALNPDEITGIQQSRFSLLDRIPLSGAEKYISKISPTRAFSISRNSFSNLEKHPDSSLTVYYGNYPNSLFSCIFGDSLRCKEVLTTDSAIEKYGKEKAYQEAATLKSAFRYWTKPKEKPPV